MTLVEGEMSTWAAAAVVCGRIASDMKTPTATLAASARMTINACPRLDRVNPPRLPEDFIHIPRSRLRPTVPWARPLVSRTCAGPIMPRPRPACDGRDVPAYARERDPATADEGCRVGRCAAGACRSVHRPHPRILAGLGDCRGRRIDHQPGARVHAPGWRRARGAHRPLRTAARTGMAGAEPPPRQRDRRPPPDLARALADNRCGDASIDSRHPACRH